MPSAEAPDPSTARLLSEEHNCPVPAERVEAVRALDIIEIHCRRCGSGRKSLCRLRAGPLRRLSFAPAGPGQYALTPMRACLQSADRTRRRCRGRSSAFPPADCRRCAASGRLPDLRSPVGRHVFRVLACPPSNRPAVCPQRRTRWPSAGRRPGGGVRRASSCRHLAATASRPDADIAEGGRNHETGREGAASRWLRDSQRSDGASQIGTILV